MPKIFLVQKGLLYIFISLITVSTSLAQDPEFTQFYANKLYLNPAFAGTANCPRVSLNYRNQWPGIDNSFVTYSASYDQQIDVIKGGLGVLIMNDQAGEDVLNTSYAHLMYSYQLQVNRKFSIRAGFQGSFVMKSLNTANLRFGDMIDPRRGFIYNTREVVPSESKNYMDLSAGLLGFSEKLYFGFAVHHLTEPDEGMIGESLMPRKYTAHFGGVFPIGLRYEDMSWSPNVLYQQQGESSQINLGLYVTKGPLVLGTWYRMNVEMEGDAFIALVGFKMDQFNVGYSYDLTTSQLAGKTAGSHEISLSYIFPCRPRKVKFETIMCPSF